MLVIYGKQDCSESTSADWLNDTVEWIWHVRTEVLDQTSLETEIKSKDGEKKDPASSDTTKFLFRHYVPYRRIQHAVEDHIIGSAMTRADVLKWLLTDDTSIIKTLKIDYGGLAEKLPSLPPKTRRDFDLWVDWAVGAICQWKENIFYGPGKGDGGGTLLDVPTGPANGKAQLDRVKEAANELKKVLPDLCLDPEVKIERALFKVNEDEAKLDEELEKADIQYLKRTREEWEQDLERCSEWPDDDEKDSDWEPMEKRQKCSCSS